MPLALHHLGFQLETRYGRTGVIKNLEEAIKTTRKAIKLTPDNDIYLASLLDSLGTKLQSRYDRTEEMKDLEEAIEVTRKALELTPDDHPCLTKSLINLGTQFVTRLEQKGEIKDLEEASVYLLEAWSCSNAVPFERVHAAAKCLELLAAQNKVDEGIDLGTKLLDLLPSVHTRALDRSDQQFVVSTSAGVASNLCSFLLSANRLHEALEFLEQGRAIIISQMLDDRSDVFSLRQDHPHLVNRYQSLVDEVNVPIRQTTPDVVESLLRKRRQEAAAELDVCLKKIRCVPGHERFMLGQTVSEVQECITEGSIVVINITNFRSDALIISRSSLRIIELPDLSASEARLWVSKDWSTRKKSEHRWMNNQFLNYLSWLWDVCVKHIAAEISASRTNASGGLPRVWWIGSGLASSMPFHAAGLHTRGSKDNAYCKMISSYTPSIKALGYAQKQAKRAQEALVAQDANIMLIAAIPTSPKGPGDKKAPKNLPGVEQEMREILPMTHSHMHATVHAHPSADQVLEDLKTCRIAHFTCHGISDYSDPSNSGLILQRSTEPDETLVQDRLTVQRVSDLQLRYAQMAHIRTFHRELALSKQEFRKYEESFRDLSPIYDRDVIRNLQPSSQDPAIPHLPIHLENVLCLCCEDQKQSYVCRSETHMREHLRFVHGRKSHHRGQRYENGILEAWLKEGVACAPIACQTLFKSSSNRRYFPVLAPELEPTSVSEPLLSEISHAPASTVGGSGELDAGASSAYLQSPLLLDTLIEEKLTQALRLAVTPAQHTRDRWQHEANPTSEQYRWIQFTEWGRYLAEHPLRAAARLLDLPSGESWNSSDMNGDSHHGNEHERQLQSEHVLRHILAALKRLVERARRTMSDGRFNVFDSIVSIPSFHAEPQGGHSSTSSRIKPIRNMSE
ncbi:hypothetical protein FPRO05_14233 [Fusarium proliferatum]|uniref:CHAT domain-containing protein n=1 Tax=Gibberella intermedia TaxID=948311 RepID=A0A365MTH7_GIBIN|nr:hypothetical protein FPRO05_14233 [Fusarium proliferatum]